MIKKKTLRKIIIFEAIVFAVVFVISTVQIINNAKEKKEKAKIEKLNK